MILHVKFWFIVVDVFDHNSQNNFGKSTMYIESLKAIIYGHQTAKKHIPRDVILEEAQEVASCSYEKATNWGKEASIHTYISSIYMNLFKYGKKLITL